MVYKHANAYIFYLNNHLKIQTTSLSNTYFTGPNAVFQVLLSQCSIHKVVVYSLQSIQDEVVYCTYKTEPSSLFP